MRGAGFVWSPLLKKSSRVSKQMMNIEDWLPTLYSAAGGAESDLPPLLGTFIYYVITCRGEGGQKISNF